jgi:hypothetical protein
MVCGLIDPISREPFEQIPSKICKVFNVLMRKQPTEEINKKLNLIPPELVAEFKSFLEDRVAYTNNFNCEIINLDEERKKKEEEILITEELSNPTDSNKTLFSQICEGERTDNKIIFPNNIGTKRLFQSIDPTAKNPNQIKKYKISSNKNKMIPYIKSQGADNYNFTQRDNQSQQIIESKEIMISPNSTFNLSIVTKKLQNENIDSNEINKNVEENSNIISNTSEENTFEEINKFESFLKNISEDKGVKVKTNLCELIVNDISDELNETRKESKISNFIIPNLTAIKQNDTSSSIIESDIFSSKNRYNDSQNPQRDFMIHTKGLQKINK